MCIPPPWLEVSCIEAQGNSWSQGDRAKRRHRFPASAGDESECRSSSRLQLAHVAAGTGVDGDPKLLHQPEVVRRWFQISVTLPSSPKRKMLTPENSARFPVGATPAD